MSGQTIHYLKITNFKSIDSLEVRNLKPFSVFAGANASGKSNFFDALDFVRTFMESGAEIRQQPGRVGRQGNRMKLQGHDLAGNKF